MNTGTTKSVTHNTRGQLDVAVLIAVRNEEKNIAEAIKSVKWAKQVFVIDSNSTDRTTEIALAHGAQVVQFHYNGGWPKKRNWAIRELPIDANWILILDGDERVDEALQLEISTAIEDPTVNGYYLRWKFIFLGAWMKHCWSHGWMLRLFRRGCAEYEDLGLRNEGGWDAEVHENVVLATGKAGRLKAWLIHDTCEDLTFWIKKQNEFSTWNAVRRIHQLNEPVPTIKDFFSSDPRAKRKWMKAVFIRMPCRPFLTFIFLYFIKLGCLDGRAGYYFCRLRSIHEFNIGVKIFELQGK